jgi:dTDP-4-dehydrorhamnose 3,5-epimerase
MQVGSFAVTQFSIQGPLLISPKVWGDSRGFFTERYRSEEFRTIGLPPFVQENYSRSQNRVLRGLHYQWDQPQGKCVTATRGRIFDVALDIRPKSPTYGQHLSVILEGNKPEWFWIPAGFAHGFCVLSEEGADVDYKEDAIYNPKAEAAILWNDPALKIDWPIDNPTLSAKDIAAITFADYQKDPKF